MEVASPRDLAALLKPGMPANPALAWHPALTGPEQYGGAMEPAQKPDVAGLVQALGSARDAMGGPIADRMAQHGAQQRARMASGDYSPTPLTGESIDLADSVAGALMGSISKVGKADDIARLLREGRAAEVTDEMLGALTPNDQARLFELYESGATGMDLPMDEASRAGRAKAQGFDVDAFHASGASEPFARFRPGSRGSTYFAATPNRAQVGAAGGAQDLAHLSAGPTERAPQSIMPMRLRGDDVGNFRPPRDVWDALPEVVTEDQAQQLAQQAGGNYWWDVFDERQIKAPRWDANDNLIDPGQFEYVRKPYPAQEYTARSGDWRESARMLPGYNTGDDLRSLDYVRRQGQRGFMVSDEAGASIVMDPSAPIRSRHARFDPRLSKNADLLASVAGSAGLGLAATAAERDRQR